MSNPLKSDSEEDENMNLNLNHLMYFRAVANKGNITRAAEELHISQPALSRTISKLEEDLNVMLFIRQGNNIRLSHAGRVFLFRVEQILANLDDSVSEIRQMSDLEHGNVSFSVTSIELIEDFMLRYFTEHPRIQVFFRITTKENIINDLERRRCNFAIVEGQPIAPRITWKPLLRDPYLVLVSKENALAQNKEIDMSALKSEPFIVPNTDFTSGVYGDMFTKLCNLAGFEPYVSFKGLTSGIVYQFVAHNRGVMVIPASVWLCSKNPALSVVKNSITALKIKSPVFVRELGIATLRDGIISSTTEKILIELERYYKEINEVLAESGMNPS